MMIGAFGVLPGDTNADFLLNLESELFFDVGMLQDNRE
jgi:hypothetical protein